MGKISTTLPAQTSAALAAMLENRPRGALRERAARLSQDYRARKTTRDAAPDETAALAYAVTRLPATYAAAVAVFSRLSDEIPDFAPQSLLDLGCGTGAASLAALEIFPEIGAATLLDRSGAFLALARRFLAASGHAALNAATIIDADLLKLAREAAPPADLVILGYALTEIADADLPRLIDTVWPLVGGALAVIEPGTPRDHTRLMAVRERLIARGAHVLAPCPHQDPCPLAAPDWCHFVTRLPRSREHRLAKGGDAPFEDEKFSYLIVGRAEGARDRSRVLAPPERGKAGVDLKLCRPRGISRVAIAKRDKCAYERVKKIDWGDALALPEDAE